MKRLSTMILGEKEQVHKLTVKDGTVVIKDGYVKHHTKALRQSDKTTEAVSLAGARAAVESIGEIDKRITATRLALAGPFALAMRKKKDQRELFLTVEGTDGGFLVSIDPEKQASARQFAMAVNNAARQA